MASFLGISLDFFGALTDLVLIKMGPSDEAGQFFILIQG